MKEITSGKHSVITYVCTPHAPVLAVWLKKIQINRIITGDENGVSTPTLKPAPCLLLALHEELQQSIYSGYNQ